MIKVQPPIDDWVYPLWMDVNWGKKNILLDIKSGYGKAKFAKLLHDSDVLINGMRPEALGQPLRQRWCLCSWTVGGAAL